MFPKGAKSANISVDKKLTKSVRPQRYCNMFGIVVKLLNKNDKLGDLF